MILDRILLCRILRLRRAAQAASSIPPQCDPRGAFFISPGNFSRGYKKAAFSILIQELRRRIFNRVTTSLRPALADRTSASACQHFSAVTGGTHRSLAVSTRRLSFRHMHCSHSSVRRSEAMFICIPLIPLSMISHPDIQQDFSVKLPSDYSLHHRIYQLFRSVDL